MDLKLKNIISVLLVLAIFFFLGRTLYNSYSEIANFEFTINWSLAIVSIVYPIIFFLLMGYAWRICLEYFGYFIHKKKGIYYWCKSQLWKYIPGKIWYVICRAQLLSRDNVPKQDSYASMVLEMVFLTDAALILAVIFLNKSISNIMNIYLAFALIVLGLIAIHPKLLNFIVSKIKRLNINLKKDYLHMLKLLIFYLFIFFVSCIGFYFFASSIYHGLNFYYAVGSFALSYFLGLAVIFSPGGLGVREGILSLMLSSVMPLPMAIIIAFATRIWWTLAELISILISWQLAKNNS